MSDNLDSAAGGGELDRLNEKLHVLTAENRRLRASAAAALNREEQAEGHITALEEQLLYLRRRSLHWYLNEVGRVLQRIGLMRKS